MSTGRQVSSLAKTRLIRNISFPAHGLGCYPGLVKPEQHWQWVSDDGIGYYIESGEKLNKECHREKCFHKVRSSHLDPTPYLRFFFRQLSSLGNCLIPRFMNESRICAVYRGSDVSTRRRLSLTVISNQVPAPPFPIPSPLLPPLFPATSLL